MCWIDWFWSRAHQIRNRLDMLELEPCLDLCLWYWGFELMLHWLLDQCSPNGIWFYHLDGFLRARIISVWRGVIACSVLWTPEPRQWQWIQLAIERLSEHIWPMIRHAFLVMKTGRISTKAKIHLISALFVMSPTTSRQERGAQWLDFFLLLLFSMEALPQHGHGLVDHRVILLSHPHIRRNGLELAFLAFHGFTFPVSAATLRSLASFVLNGGNGRRQDRSPRWPGTRCFPGIVWGNITTVFSRSWTNTLFLRRIWALRLLTTRCHRWFDQWLELAVRVLPHHVS